MVWSQDVWPGHTDTLQDHVLPMEDCVNYMLSIDQYVLASSRC